ncbi:hypothetical protein ACFW04_013746 [Cataglyphis niger]
MSETKKPKRNFSEGWLKDDRFQSWIRKVSFDDSLFHCIVCNKNFTCSLSHVIRHADSAKSKKHIIKCKENETNKSSEDINELFLPFEERKKSAEIQYALIADKNISHQLAKDILTFFQEMGKDYNVLKIMNMGRTKCTNIISNVIQNTKFSIFIDKTSDILNEKWMTFFVQYVDPKTLNIYCSAEKLFNAFKIEMWKLNIPFVNIVALSCDNASIMIGKHLSFKKKLEEFCKNLITLPCPCHSTALVAHAACTKIPDQCEEFKKKIATFINSNPKRSAIYQEFCECFQETNLKLSNARWLSHHSCVERLLDEKIESGTYLLSMMQNLDIKAYFLFLQNILNFFNSFNTFFQAIETRIHLLQLKSVEFLITVCKYFLKSEHLNNLCNNIKFDENENQKSLEEVFLGTKCEEYLNELLKKGHAEIVTNIRKNYLLPINDKFLSKLKVFASSLALLNINRETSFNDVSFSAETLGGFDENGLKKEWLTLHLDFTIIGKEELLKLSFDDIDKYPNLKRHLNAVRSLPTSNTDPERMFSILTDV